MRPAELYPPSCARRCRHPPSNETHKSQTPYPTLTPITKKKSHTRYQKKLIPPVLRPKGLHSSTRRPDVYHIRQHRIHGDAPTLSLTTHQLTVTAQSSIVKDGVSNKSLSTFNSRWLTDGFQLHRKEILFRNDSDAGMY